MKQFSIQFQTFDEMWKEHKRLAREAEQLLLYIWQKQYECEHDWSEFVYTPVKIEKHSDYPDDPSPIFGPDEIPVWTRECKICRFRREYSFEEHEALLKENNKTQ